MATWGDLFDRASEDAVTVDRIWEALSERRDRTMEEDGDA